MNAAGARALLTLAASSALVGCILLVDAPEIGPSCAFAGKETDCGTCITRRCSTQLDACCGDDWCDGLVRDVEGCATARDERCAAIRAVANASASASSSSAARPERAALASCVATYCRGVCEPAAPTSSTYCTETRFGAGQACLCRLGTTAQPANRYRCDAAAFPENRCCAPPGWPSAGNECTCFTVSCTPTADGCSCFLTDTFDARGTRTCEGPHCCQTSSNCRCGPSPCGTGEVPVDSCNATTTPCAARTVPQESGCSLP